MMTANQNCRRLFTKFIFSSLLTVLFTFSVHAQTSSGAIEGTVADNTGALIPAASVRLRHKTTGVMRTVQSDEQGFFRAASLPIGKYEVSVEQSGFAPYVYAEVPLSIGQTVRLTVTLTAGGVEEKVTITDTPPPLDATQTTVTTNIIHEQIEELPVRSRNYLDFVLLAPGVSDSAQRQNNSAQTPLADSGFTFGGLRARSNNLSIDGLDNNDAFTGSNRTELSLEIVREFQVVNNGLSAEAGGASGGSINVVTKTGTNIVKGDLFGYFQNDAFNARNPFATGNRYPDLRRWRGGGSFGGPIVKDRTFFYTAIEQESRRAESESDISPIVANQINTLLSSGRFSRLTTRHINTNLFPVAGAETEYAVKLNHNFTQQHSLMLRYAFTNSRNAGGAFHTSPLTDASARGSSFARDHAVAGSLVSLFGSKAVGDFRFQTATRRVVLRTNDQTGAGIDINGVINFGGSYEGNSRRTEKTYQTSYTLAITQAAHFLKTGATFNRSGLSVNAPDGYGAGYTFSSLDDFLAGRAASFRQAFGSPNTDFAVNRFGAFVQDKWTVNQHLTIDAGIRYDVERLPKGFKRDTANFSPRLGLAFSPSDKWVMRAGYGLFYDRYVLAALNRAIQKDGRGAFELVTTDAPAANLFSSLQGGAASAPLQNSAFSIFRADPRLEASDSHQGNASVEYLLGKDATISANYLFVRGEKLSRTRNINVSPVALQNRQNTAFNDIWQIEHAAGSTYHGLSLSLNRRFAKEFLALVSYTFSKTIDDASDFDEQPQNPFRLRDERALSRNHQGQRLVISSLFDLPIGEEEKGKAGRQAAGAAEMFERIFSHIQLAPIVTVTSGRPVNPLIGIDANRTHALPLSSRPVGFSRNALMTPTFFTVDLRTVKYFPIGERRRLNLSVEFFNLFNRVNVSQLNQFFGIEPNARASFGKPINAFNPRQLQFAFTLEY